MYLMGIAKPVYITNARLNTDAGAIACPVSEGIVSLKEEFCTCAKVRERAAIDRKYIDMVSVHADVKTKKTKKCPGVRLKFVMKYSARPEPVPVRILLGRSQSIEA
jgi:hypothetical protein